MWDALQHSTWFMFAAFGSGILMLFSAFIKWGDARGGSALPTFLVACLAFAAGFAAMSKSDDMTRDWFEEQHAPAQVEPPDLTTR